MACALARWLWLAASRSSLTLGFWRRARDAAVTFLRHHEGAGERPETIYQYMTTLRLEHKYRLNTYLYINCCLNLCLHGSKENHETPLELSGTPPLPQENSVFLLVARSCSLPQFSFGLFVVTYSYKITLCWDTQRQQPLHGSCHASKR